MTTRKETKKSNACVSIAEYYTIDNKIEKKPFFSVIIK